jgi:Methyltransferase FkbM domain
VLGVEYRRFGPRGFLVHRSFRQVQPLSDADGDSNDLRHSLLPFDSSAPTIEVNCRSIDSFCEEHGITSIDLLKVDTEGHDMAVLRGSSRMLASTNFVYSRIFPFELTRAKDRPYSACISFWNLTWVKLCGSIYGLD